jgi:hypothetical protein
VGEVFFAGEEADQGAALFGDLVAHGPAEHWVAGLDGVEDRALGYGAGYFELDLAGDAC